MVENLYGGMTVFTHWKSLNVRVQEYAFWEWLKAIMSQWGFRPTFKLALEVPSGWDSHGSGHRIDTQETLDVLWSKYYRPANHVEILKL